MLVAIVFTEGSPAVTGAGAGTFSATILGSVAWVVTEVVVGVVAEVVSGADFAGAEWADTELAGVLGAATPALYRVVDTTSILREFGTTGIVTTGLGIATVGGGADASDEFCVLVSCVDGSL